MRKILFALFALTTACASDSTTDPDDTNPGDGNGDGDGGGGGGDDPNVSEADRQQDYDDVAASLGAHLSASELPIMVDSVDMAFGRMPAGFSFTDTPEARILEGTRGGLNLRYELHCHDLADALTACDGLQDHSHVDFTYSGVSGSLAGVESTANWIVRGSQRPRLWILGDGEDVFASNLPTGDYSLALSDTMQHVKFEPTPLMPVEGSISIRVAVDRVRPAASPANRTFSVDAIVQFTRDAATLTLDGSRTYGLDIASGAVTRQ